MDQTHKLFHKLANHLNNINLIAGLAKEELKTSSGPEDKGAEKDTRLIDALGKIENNVTSMADTLEELRNIVKPQ
jgi:two-component sensor histidine kinase